MINYNCITDFDRIKSKIKEFLDCYASSMKISCNPDGAYYDIEMISYNIVNDNIHIVLKYNNNHINIHLDKNNYKFLLCKSSSIGIVYTDAHFGVMTIFLSNGYKADKTYPWNKKEE